jgi:hypothetical protein
MQVAPLRATPAVSYSLNVVPMYDGEERYVVVCPDGEVSAWLLLEQASQLVDQLNAGEVTFEEARLGLSARLEAINPSDRNAVAKEIRRLLRTRSGKDWSITGGRGSGYGWLRIEAPPKRRVFNEANPAYNHSDSPTWQAEEGIDPYLDVEPAAGEKGDYTSKADCIELCKLLGLDEKNWRLHRQGVQIPANNDFYREFLSRARGQEPYVFGQRYWD